MDLHNVIRELVEERRRITQIVESLERLTGAGLPATKPPVNSGQGRKAMDAKAREEVSLRMKKYWEGRRKNGG